MRKEIFARCLADERLAGPIGRYNVSLTCKAAHVMDSRRLTLYIQGWLGWVEDAIHVVIDQFLFGDGKVSDYLGYEFPPEFPQDERITRIKDERRTLLFRIRHMFRALAGVAKHYEYFEQWKFTVTPRHASHRPVGVYCELANAQLTGIWYNMRVKGNGE